MKPQLKKANRSSRQPTRRPYTSKTRLGRFSLGCRMVNLFVRPGHGGNLSLAGDDDRAEIVIGMDQDEWREIVATALHEAMEMAYIEMGLRFLPTPDVARDNGSYVFVMTHTQFSEASARASDFLVAAVPALSKAYTRHWGAR